MPIPTLRQADNGFYYAHWSEGRRSKRTSMGTQQEAEATERFAQWLLIGGQTDAVGTLTVAELWKVYRMRHKVFSPETLDRSWKNLEPHFGAMTPAEIDDVCAQAYLAKRAAGKIGRPSKSWRRPKVPVKPKCGRGLAAFWSSGFTRKAKRSKPASRSSRLTARLTKSHWPMPRPRPTRPAAK